MTELGRATYGAFMERLGFAAGVYLESSAPRGSFTAMPRLVNDLGTEEDQVIAQRREERHAIGIRIDDEAEQKGGC